jgi:hypothetical protein
MNSSASSSKADQLRLGKFGDCEKDRVCATVRWWGLAARGDANHEKAVNSGVAVFIRFTFMQLVTCLRKAGANRVA